MQVVAGAVMAMAQGRDLVPRPRTARIPPLLSLSLSPSLCLRSLSPVFCVARILADLTVSGYVPAGLVPKALQRTLFHWQKESKEITTLQQGMVKISVNLQVAGPMYLWSEIPFRDPSKTLSTTSGSQHYLSRLSYPREVLMKTWPSLLGRWHTGQNATKFFLTVCSVRECIEQAELWACDRFLIQSRVSVLNKGEAWRWCCGGRRSCVRGIYESVNLPFVYSTCINQPSSSVHASSLLLKYKTILSHSLPYHVIHTFCYNTHDLIWLNSSKELTELCSCPIWGDKWICWLNIWFS